MERVEEIRLLSGTSSNFDEPDSVCIERLRDLLRQVLELDENEDTFRLGDLPADKRVRSTVF